MPNMSRRSLEHHHERVNQMIQRDPSQASFLRTRYESFMALRKRRSAADYSYDSGDDVDLSQFGKNSSFTTVTSETWLRRIFTAIITFFTSIYTSTTSIFRGKHSGNIYYSRYAVQEKRGKHSCTFFLSHLRATSIRNISPLPTFLQEYFDALVNQSPTVSRVSSVTFIWRFRRYSFWTLGFCDHPMCRVARKRDFSLACWSYCRYS